MTTKNIKKILLNKDGNNFVADIEDIENRIIQNSSNLETAKQELSNKCNEALSEAKAYTDTEKAKYLPLTGGTVTGLLNCTASNATADVNNKELTSYIADIMGANAQLSIIKGDGTASVLSINNVLNATKATNADNATNLGGYPATDYIRSVNGINADENGNIQLGSIVKSVNSITPNEQGNVQLEGLVKSVNGVTADDNGNVTIQGRARFAVDYTAGIQVPIPLPASKFTAPSDGIYMSLIMIAENQQLYINGIVSAFRLPYSSYYGGWYSSLTLPLSKGDVIYWNSASSHGEATSIFYPFK